MINHIRKRWTTVGKFQQKQKNKKESNGNTKKYKYQR